ncbi:MAG TPA: C25 family cysteine peptidase, partial [Candidatus Cloacimonadota bacterium]|nr:C25 family cysteine peptidase [Candidatus Cloacimonadota bacterium]
MKRIIILLMSLLVTAFLFADMQLSGSEERVHLSYESGVNRSDETSIQQLLAIPSEEVELNILACEVEVYDKAGNLLETKRESGEQFARIEQSFVMRELYAHQLVIDLAQPQENGEAKLKNIELEVCGTSRATVPTKVSKAYLPIYREMVDNFDNSYLRNLEVQQSKMLIIAHNDATLLNVVNYFTDWKNAKGIDTEVVKMEDIGTTNAAIKNYIQTVYNSEEYPPDYL